MSRMDQLADARYAQGVSKKPWECAQSAGREIAFPPARRTTSKTRVAASRRAKTLLEGRGALDRHRRKLALGVFICVSGVLSPAFAGGLTVEAAWVAPNENA